MFLKSCFLIPNTSCTPVEINLTILRINTLIKIVNTFCALTLPGFDKHIIISRQTVCHPAEALENPMPIPRDCAHSSKIRKRRSTCSPTQTVGRYSKECEGGDIIATSSFYTKFVIDQKAAEIIAKGLKMPKPPRGPSFREERERGDAWLKRRLELKEC
jgi:hypothetical protein